MKLTFRRFLLPLGLLAFTVPADAQRISSPYRFLDPSQEIGGFVAQIWPDEGSIGLGATKGAAYGGRYSIRIGGPFAVAVEGIYFPTEHAVLDSVVVDSAFQRISSAEQSLVIATAALRFNLTGPRTWHGVQPFVEFGGGVVIETSTDTEEIEKAPNEARFDFGTSFAGKLGAGIAWLPSQHFAIRVDGRNLLWKVKTPAALTRGNIGRAVPTDEWLQNFTVSAGLSILF